MIEYEDAATERMAQLEQEDYERCQRDIRRNSSNSYADEIPNYDDEFQRKLPGLLDMVRGIINSLKPTTSSSEHGSALPTMDLQPLSFIDDVSDSPINSDFRFEPASELHSDAELVVKAVKEINEMTDALPTEIRGGNICDLVEESLENNQADRLFDEMTKSIHAALLAEQMHTKLDLHLDSTFGNDKLIEEQQVEKHDCSAFGESRACNVFDKMSKPSPIDFQLEEEYYGIVVTGTVELGKIQEVFAERPEAFIAIRQPFYIEYFNDITLFDPGGNVLYVMRSSGGVLPELFGIPLGTSDHGVEGVDLRKFVMEGNTYSVFKKMPKSKLTRKGFNDGVRYGRYTEKEIATQGSNGQISQFRLIPNLQNLWLLSYSKQEEYEGQVNCISLEPSLIYSLVDGEFNAYNHLLTELCCCLLEWVKSKDNKIDWVVSMWNSWEVLLWYCCVMSWRCTRPFDDFHVGALAQRCITCDQPRLNNGHGISAGNAKVHITAVGMPSQIVSCEDKYCFIGFNHFGMFESDSPATIYLVYDSIAQRYIFFKSLFLGANSMLLRKFLYCWTFPLDKLTIELRLVMFCFDPGEFHRPQMGCDTGRWIKLTIDREHYNIFRQHLAFYTLEDKSVLKRMGIGTRVALKQEEWLDRISANHIAYELIRKTFIDVVMVILRFLVYTAAVEYVVLMKWSSGEPHASFCSNIMKGFVWDPGTDIIMNCGRYKTKSPAAFGKYFDTMPLFVSKDVKCGAPSLKLRGVIVSVLCMQWYDCLVHVRRCIPHNIEPAHNSFPSLQMCMTKENMLLTNCHRQCLGFWFGDKALMYVQHQLSCWPYFMGVVILISRGSTISKKLHGRTTTDASELPFSILFGISESMLCVWLLYLYALAGCYFGI